MQCAYCGRDIPDDARWCPYCGAEQAPPEELQDENIPSDGWQDDPAPPDDRHGEDAASGWQDAPADDWDDEAEPPDDSWADDPPVPGWEDDAPYEPAPETQDAPRSKALLIAIFAALGVALIVLLIALNVKPKPKDPAAAVTPSVTATAEPSAAPTPTPTPTPTPKPEPTYEVVTADVSWADAEAAAEAKGGHLVVIDSAEKWTRVAQLADESGLTYVWIGLHRTDSGELAWVKDNVDPVYNWASGEPSVHDTNGAAEDYVLITRTNSGWYYNDCIGDPAGRYPQFYSGKIGYIIEIDP